MIIRRILNAAVRTVQYMLLGLLIFMAVSQLDIGPLRFIVVRSGSMEPTIRTGALAVVDVTASAREGVAVDDVVLFDDPEGRPILHRVVATSNEGLMTKGDANEEPDPWRVERVKGVEIVSVPLAGYGLQYLQNGFKVIAMALR